ncbi:MAG TPA: RES domain-containing protein [Longimicrobium sp.]|nr:RES domain-containing protein [Longimicrobium sp.]
MASLTERRLWTPLERRRAQRVFMRFSWRWSTASRSDARCVPRLQDALPGVRRDRRRNRGGRWNSPGRPLIYCADSFAGSLLEILVHANAPVALPGAHHCARASVPDGVALEALEEAELPGWADGNPRVSRAFGDRWLQEQRTYVLAVPAATARLYGRNLLLNPAHPDYARIVLESGGARSMGRPALPPVMS